MGNKCNYLGADYDFTNKTQHPKNAYCASPSDLGILEGGHLDPMERYIELREPKKSEILRFCLEHLPNGQWEAFQISFWKFRLSKDDFSSLNISYSYRANPISYWESLQGDHPEIAKFAQRIFELVCNSVPSERAFSTMNLIHTPQRNRLDPEKVSMLSYIYMNQRVFDRLEGKVHLENIDLEEEVEQVQMEEFIMNDELDEEDREELEDVREIDAEE